MRFRNPVKYALLCAVLMLFAFGFNGMCAGSTASMEKNIRQGTNLNLDDLTKSVDMTIEAVINQAFNNPSLGGGFYPMEATCSHGVVTLEGKVRYPVIKERAEEVAKNTERVKKVINNIKVDPNLEPDVVDLLGDDWGFEEGASSAGSKPKSQSRTPKAPGGSQGGSIDDILKGLGS